MTGRLLFNVWWLAWARWSTWNGNCRFLRPSCGSFTRDHRAVGARVAGSWSATGKERCEGVAIWSGDVESDTSVTQLYSSRNAGCGGKFPIRSVHGWFWILCCPDLIRLAPHERFASWTLASVLSVSIFPSTKQHLFYRVRQITFSF